MHAELLHGGILTEEIEAAFDTALDQRYLLI